MKNVLKQDILLWTPILKNAGPLMEEHLQDSLRISAESQQTEHVRLIQTVLFQGVQMRFARALPKT